MNLRSLILLVLVSAALLSCSGETTVKKTSRASKTVVQPSDGTFKSSCTATDTIRLLAFYDKNSKKWGAKDETGKLIIPCEYKSLNVSENSFCIVKIGRQFGVVNRKNKVVIPIKYSSIEYLFNDLFKVEVPAIPEKESEKYGIMMGSGKVILPVKYDIITNEGQYALAGIYEESWEPGPVTSEYYGHAVLYKSRLIDHKGSISKQQFLFSKYYPATNHSSLSLLYPHIKHVKSEIRVLSTADFREVYVDYLGKALFNKHFDLAEGFENGYAVVGKIADDHTPEELFWKKNRYEGYPGMYWENATSYKYGLINSKGQIILPCKYDWLVNIGNKHFAAGRDGKSGCINARDQVLIPFEYDLLYRAGNYFVFGEAQPQTPPERDSLPNSITSFNLHPQRTKYKHGLLDASGKVLFPAVYDEIKIDPKNKNGVYLDGELVFIDKKAKRLK